jgi:DNA topoisomerase-2
LIFREEDSNILNYLEEDGQKIEPDYYIPIIPMILVNGGVGIGTGFSTNIPQFNPSDIIETCIDICDNMTKENDNVQKMSEQIEKTKIKEFVPWYLGFTGKIEKSEKGTYVSKGVYNWVDDKTVEITELPVGTWTEDYKEFLEGLIVTNSNNLKSFESHYTSKTVKFILNFVPGSQNTSDSKFETEFKLVSAKNMGANNMHLYSNAGAIKKYTSTSNILKEWAHVRIAKYDERKKHQIKIIEKEYYILSSKIRFIIDVIEGRIVIMNKKMSDIAAKLVELKYKPIDKNSTEDKQVDESNDNGFSYLLKMPISQLTFERKKMLEKDVEELSNKLNVLKNTSIEKIWKSELLELQAVWNSHRDSVIEDYNNDTNGIVFDKKQKKRRAIK